ncbi:hypothetical protein HELRODRAFT_173620 [Helobdella robusta]|uniref:C3H1-type domain-containing protein n=1 Tax=Helobdella robusta TaxID=6412 RepID=T1F722_HELRO|nr:hypothetical protein HELRODRAFT_173620 [Helobdella robusta]ESO03333.1 hypothetical protein HELRODRAFT_173620 [Helobdella robusta]
MADSSLSSPVADNVDHVTSLDEFPQDSSVKMLLDKNEILDNGKSAADDDSSLDNESTKETAMIDDHGELDYEEDVDDSIEKNEAEIKIQEQMSTFEVQKAMDDDIKGGEKRSNVDDGSHSSDGELADDDCEEGEIKEPGAKKPFSRELCRFFSRGSCTWGINCRFLHPGVNDKGNYTMHERLGKRMPPPPRLSEIAGESAWERGLRHAKDFRSKKKKTDGDDKKGTSTSPLASDKLIHPDTSSHLARPVHRDSFYEDMHQTLSTSLPDLPPMPLPILPILHHPINPWLYRHPFDYEMRWPALDYMHSGFHPVHDFRMIDPGKERRFSPPSRTEASQPIGGERASRRKRHHAEGTTNSGERRRKCEEGKDSWSRAKSPKNKRSSSSRSGKKSRSRYSSSSSSSNSSKSGSRSRSSSSSSYSSSRSSSSSRSRSSSKLSKWIPSKVVPVRSIKNSDISKSFVSNVVPPCVAEMNESSTVVSTTVTKLTGTASVTANQAPITVTSLTSEPPRPAMTSLSITLANSKTNELQPVNKSFKDADENNNDGQMKSKSKLPTFSDNTNLLVELNKVGGQLTTVGGVTYKSGIVQGNVGYPIPIKSSAPLPATTVRSKPKSVHSNKKISEKKKRSRSRGSSASSDDSLSSLYSSSHSSRNSSSASAQSHRAHLRTSDYLVQKMHPFAPVQRMGRGFRDGRDGSFWREKRDFHMDSRGAGQGRDMRAPYRKNLRMEERGVHSMDYPVRNMEHSRVDSKMYSRPGGRAGQTVDARIDVRNHRMGERMLPKKEEKRDERRQPGRRMNQPVMNRMSKERHDKSYGNNRDHQVVNRRYQRREGEVEGDVLEANRRRQSPEGYRRVVNKSTTGHKHQEVNAPTRSSQRQHELPPPSSSRKRHSSPSRMRPQEKHMKIAYENKDLPASDSSRQPAPSRQQRSSCVDDVNRKTPSAKYGKMQSTTSESKKSTSSRTEELLMELKAVEDAIANKRSKIL